MRQFYKTLLAFVCMLGFFAVSFAQSDKFWSANTDSKSSIVTHKAVARLSFPKEFKLFNLNQDAIKQQLFKVVDNAQSHSTIISIPNAAGQLEEFEVYEASNFDAKLQAQFPEIRAFSGRGITNPSSTLKLSYSPQGIQTMVFRTSEANEFIELYSADQRTYAVFTSQRSKGRLPWTCSTQEQEMFGRINQTVQSNFNPESNTGELKTMRLAQSCNGEYSNWFGATSAAQVGLVLAAFNATLTRTNGCYEKDLALHLNLVSESVNVIYYDPASDPYTTMGAWNTQLQIALNTTLTGVGTSITVNNAAYDIGHMFGASGGGGNAGCIGCVCVDGVASGNGSTKGRGITSPADGIPQGDNFDIDYVAHEIGHQLGANHTFSMSTEGSGVNKEVGSGITIMGYAGITAQDVAPHSIDIFHQASIQQVQVNLATKTCPITTNITAVNATPVVSPHPNYTIPMSTPFQLTGVATDANPGDVLTYCWEQDDNGTGQTGNNSVARENKPTGPNWLTFPATTSPTRYFPRLSTILAGQFITGPLPGGDAIANIEALSNVARDLRFRLTVRDNSPYSSTAPVKIGQTAFTDMIVTVTTTSGPFMVTQPNTNVSWPENSVQTVTWNVANSTAPPVSTANVRILLSTDGGFTFPTVLVANTPNDGSETVTIPAGQTTTARVKIEGIGNIFFDISNSNFTITQPPTGFTFNSLSPTTITCASTTSATVSLGTTVTGSFATPIVLSATAGVPAGTTVSFSPNPLTPGNATVMTLTNTNTLSNGTYNITVTGTAGSTVQTATVPFVVSGGTAPSVTSPSNVTVCAGATANFTTTASGPAVTGYQWQVNTGSGFTNIAGATSASYTTAATTGTMNNYQYRVLATGQCGVATSAAATLTVNTAPAISAQPATQVVCAGNNATFSVTASGTGLSYQWQLNTGSGFTNIAGATSATYTATAVTLAQNGHQYQVIITGTCGTPVTSSAATLSVGNSAAITGEPANLTVCVGANPVNFTVTATGSSLTYQWQVNTGSGFTNIAGATSPTYNAGPATATQNGYQYRVNVFSCTPTPIVSQTATLTVNVPVSITTPPSAVTLCAGANASFSVVAAGTANTYQWQVAPSCAGPWTNIAGATSATLNVNAVTASQNGFGYRVIITNSCNSVTSACVALTVNTPIVITTPPANTSVCLPTTTASFSVAVTGTAPTYQWQVNTGTGFTNIAGQTSATLNLTGLTAAMNGYQYQVVISGTCTNSITSAPATLTVNSPVAITDQPDNTSICAGSNGSISVTATGSTITYQWQVSVANGPFTNLTNTAPYSGVTTPTLNITNATAPFSGFRYRVVVSGVPCGAVNSDTVTLTVNPVPGVVLTAAEQNVINPATPTGLYTTVAATGTYTYQWFRNGVLVPGQTGPSITPVTVDWFGDYYVIATNQFGCSATSNTVTISEASSKLVFIYPNPSAGAFQVRYYTDTPTEFSVNVFDSKGARVWSKKYQANAIYERMDVDLGRNSAGTYTVEVRSAAGKQLATGRVVITR